MPSITQALVRASLDRGRGCAHTMTHTWLHAMAAPPWLQIKDSKGNIWVLVKWKGWACDIGSSRREVLAKQAPGKGHWWVQGGEEGCGGGGEEHYSTHTVHMVHYTWL